MEKSSKIKEYSHISLRALNPVDIIVTKIGRLNQRDIQDIEKCIKEFKISKTEIRKRAAQVSPTYVSKEQDYLYHLNWVLEKVFKNKKRNHATKNAK